MKKNVQILKILLGLIGLAIGFCLSTIQTPDLFVILLTATCFYTGASLMGWGIADILSPDL